MPVVIPDGGGEEQITSSELTAYAAARYEKNTITGQYEARPSGATGSQALAVSDSVESKLATIAENHWNVTQQQIQAEVLERGAILQAQLTESVRQWAKPGRDRALLEMFGVLTGALIKRDREILELLARLEGSPW